MQKKIPSKDIYFLMVKILVQFMGNGSKTNLQWWEEIFGLVQNDFEQTQKRF